MSHIIAAREQYGIPEVQMAAHASDFVVAGSETTATALSCITYYLQKRPNILRKLQDEVRSAFSSYGEIDSESTQRLKYLKAVCLEAMRVYPPLPFSLPRVVPAGGADVDGHYLPGGTIVSTNPFAASMSSANFIDPWEFRPERWLGENTADDLEASQPFSHGPRSCLGRSLGWMELRTFLAKMHFEYDFELLDPELDWHKESEMHTLWQKPKLMVRVFPRKK
ncbi:Cytochrome P450 [Macrophomina phaseolina MS6]|uniref:Cytochrome P450 n=1 Tax=Macrophomina phaseolina (strain MS6) TaxID=1126212 RepID=K2QS42_MACPH|nr:Cytochrome P450 [Macrophomina phaseolina MS6]